MDTLRIDAISANQIRAKLATKLADECPPHLGEGIAITGSVARGYADAYSDVEMTFWVNSLHPAEEYLAWLRTCDAVVDAEADVQLIPGCWLTTKSRYRGILFEIAWETWDSLAESLELALTGEVTDHWALTNVWQVADAAPLRDHPELARWRAALRSYPDALQHKLITSAISAWAEPHGYPLSVFTLWPLALRDARLALNTRLIREVERVLRVVFALNRRWEADWKWLAFECKRLDVQPEGLVERVNTIFSTVDAHESVRLCLQLMIDTLELLPPTFDTSTQLLRIDQVREPDGLV
jgi:hypothetical protein